MLFGDLSTCLAVALTTAVVTTLRATVDWMALIAGNAREARTLRVRPSQRSRQDHLGSRIVDAHRPSTVIVL